MGGCPAEGAEALPIVPADRVAGRRSLGGCVPAYPDLRFLAVARYQVGHGVLGSWGRLALRGGCSLVGDHREQAMTVAMTAAVAAVLARVLYASMFLSFSGPSGLF